MIKLTKREITEAVLKQLPYDEQSVDKTVRSWWLTMSGQGLRLTDMGDRKFREANIEFYECPINVKKVSWVAFLVDCNKKLSCPYFLGIHKKENEKAVPYIRLYDSKIAMMLTLYGDIYSYLESINSRKLD